jgi:hypothetical protein
MTWEKRSMTWRCCIDGNRREVRGGIGAVSMKVRTYNQAESREDERNSTSWHEMQAKLKAMQDDKKSGRLLRNALAVPPVLGRRER